MEWSWLKDWWRLKRPRRKYRRNRAGANTEPGVADSDCEQYGDQAAGEPGTYNRHNARSRACSFDCDDETICYCDECMNGDLDSTDGLDSDDSSASGKQVVVAVCAMAKKSQSKPMKEILTRLQEFEFIKMIVFSEEIILGEPVEKWPICDCLISFHSKGFPLDKAIQYAQLRQPYVINNLHMQFDIQVDRRRVYAILEKEGIEIPRYAVLDRDSPDPKQHELVESEDHVEVNGIIFNKPFVEKPVSAEDHNIYIYYPTSAGGGSQRLFRKIGSRSSVYSPESRVRKTGSFIYEDFMPTDGTDVKVYTVGPDYAHAEARKSPALDGKVERDSDGKEIRYPVILSNAEKLISRKVCLAFKQTVCGFDLLRANGKSFVCDVNGFSFVKNSNKYYDDSAKILGNMILRELAPTLHIPWSVPFQLDDPPIVPTTFGKMMELRCVTAVIRHGDRTPKQKMKVEVRHPKFFEIFEKYDGYKYGHIKLKRPKQLQEILDIARSLLAEIQTKAADSEIEEKQSKLEQLKSVLEMYGHFSGINRKVQMKYQPKGRPRGSSSDDGKHRSIDAPKDPSLVLILKWGGELTPAGRIQAEELGRIFRCMYPGGQSRDGKEGLGAQGLGLLRLHSTFRHDLKIYASDEGRVQMTAAAFAKGLLALEGELTPILVQMVKSANTNGLLDNDCDSSKYQNMAKSRLHELMQIDRDFTVEDRAAINPDNAISINLAMDFVKNPVKCCAHVHSLIQSLLGVVAVKRDDPKTRDAVLYHGETWELMGRRWGKIEKDFCTKSKNYDISKIPDIYDCIKYDLQHNQHTLQFDLAEELYIYAKYLADVVIPQEYGLTVHEKLTIGQGICTPLLKKIRADLQRNIEEVGDESVNRLNPRYSHGVSSPGRHVRTRLYFTSESHVHSLLTVLRYGGLLNVLTDEQWRRAMEYVSMVSELNYMSQIVIMLYEDPTKDPCSEERFHVELHFSPGVNCCVQKNLPPGPGFRPHSRNDSVTSKNASGDEESTSRIDEENDTEEENSHGSCQTLSKENSFTETFKNKDRKIRKIKSSEPIPIGSCHTVSGHEAMDLAKRLSEEIAAQQQTGLQRPLSPDEPRAARSFEHGKHGRIKDNSAIPSGGCSVAVVGGGGSGGVCQASSSHGSSHSSTGGATVRRQRHSIAGQMSYFKMLGGFGKKMATSTNSLFSTAVISGSSSAPNLRDMIPSTASPSAIEGFGGVPPIRPLETLHNALSLRQLDHFLEKMTTGPLFKTPASSPPKYPSTPLPTPTPSPAIPERSVLPTASWSGHSSMTSSMSAMSSGGPSSPNYSDMLSRGCPSSDMSASITSTDGSIALAAGGGTRDNMPKIFPMIDNDLNVLGSHFNYDQLAASINLESSAKIPPISKDGTLDISGDLTPISTCSDWEFNTNDATKGSTNTNNDLTAEDDDEDATISTDTCLSTGEITAASEESNTTPNLNITLGSTSSSKTVQKEFLFDMKNIKHDMSILRSEDLVPSSSASSYSTEVIPKIENRLRGNRIQKQISLYEKDLRTEAKNLSHELNKFGERSATSLKRTASCNAPETSHSHMSFEELQKDFPNIEKNLVSKFEHEQEKCSKSSKSVSTRLNNSPTPGALVIREGFIEPPRITRVPKSFHGKTDHHQIQVNDLARRASDLARPSSSVSALAPTALQFCGRDSANKYNKNQIRQSINTISVSNSTKTGTHTVGNAGPNGANAGLGRFTTSIVQEPPAGIMETVQRADTNTGMNQFAGDVLTASSTVGVGQSEKLPQQSSQDRADTEK
ncbi:inositol hexakisphosphate and diphosphoinositol-pentakisphosphate kinase 2 isoform X12 [Toxorhynchites rutilus septentrionalis]|uniref:inositol hexakisphosphate and diphosphoinositol-pentakisphosphate kinase 2 isoform X12 n=1 Tax=Toxorhynchites rutilus septentrionalis TaxID=329112 RepID=UPI0024790295|nr:inositol hexakisphosphate and diphosphoinositol-pentakisphosphate kinase 2 isoform X12 [Toxorhynchites rutilus septentrionalis]